MSVKRKKFTIQPNGMIFGSVNQLVGSVDVEYVPVLNTLPETIAVIELLRRELFLKLAEKHGEEKAANWPEIVTADKLLERIK